MPPQLWDASRIFSHHVFDAGTQVAIAPHIRINIYIYIYKNLIFLTFITHKIVKIWFSLKSNLVDFLRKVVEFLIIRYIFETIKN